MWAGNALLYNIHRGAVNCKSWSTQIYVQLIFRNNEPQSNFCLIKLVVFLLTSICINYD